jgi:hypothetical protein
VIACPACGTLYSPRDLGLAPGAEFRCACGATLRAPAEVPLPPPAGLADLIAERAFYGLVMAAVGWWVAWTQGVRRFGLAPGVGMTLGVLVGFAVGAALGPVILTSLYESMSTPARCQGHDDDSDNPDRP